jgi:protein-S-isoprenylcysteine O-methyltransferase Ste14
MPTPPAAHPLELKIPPGVLVILFALLMRWGAVAAPGVAVRIPWPSTLAGVVALTGLLAGLLAVLEFKRAKTTVNPIKPQSSSALVVSGIYAVSRNPIYLGLLLVLTGWALWLGNLVALAFLPLFILYLNRFQIQPEERALAALFGSDFQTYCSRVRRWI